MSLYCTEFIFDGISCREYDLIICSFEGVQSGGITAGNQIEFTTFKAPGSGRWIKTSSSYNEQLSFTFQICKRRYSPQGGIDPISEQELAFLMRWLVRKDYKRLQFIQEGYENIIYNCQINAERYMIAGQCYGLTLTVICDAPFGWSQPMTTTISSSTSKTVHLYDSSDEIGEVYPSIDLYVKESTQDIQIENLLTGTKTVIKNCVPGEVIFMENMKIKSSECKESKDKRGYDGNHTTLFNDFNYQWLTIGNTFNNRENVIIVTGNCDVTLNWCVPRKAVI